MKNMKKMTFVTSFLVLGALVLAACGGGGATNGSGTPGAVGTAVVGTTAPGVDLTGTPAAGTGTDLGTPAAGATMPAETATVDTSAAGGATAAPTTGAAGGATAEPTTGTGSIPTTGGQYVLLSDLMKMNINGQDGTQVGSVAGVVVDRGASSASGSTSGSTTGTAMPTTDASSATAMPTTAASGTGSTTAMGAGPRVSYLLVNVNGGAGSTTGTAVPTTSAGAGSATAMPTTGAGDSTGSGTAGSGTTGSSASGASGSQVLVPFQAFTVSGASTSGTTMGSATAMPTTSAGSATAMPTTSGSTAGSSMGSQNLTLTISSSDLASAPAFDATAFNGTVASDVTAYWSGKNLSIPATGASSANSSVLIRGQVGSLTVNDQSGQSLGQVSDFVVDTITGELRYAVLSGGSASSGSMYIVPVSAMTWQAGTGTSGADLGTFNATFDSSRLSSAPSVSSMSDLNLSSSDWNSQYDTYWNTAP